MAKCINDGEKWVAKANAGADEKYEVTKQWPNNTYSS